MNLDGVLLEQEYLDNVGYIQFQIGSTDLMRIVSGGNVLFQQRKKISGSTTSTGSFN